MLSTSAENCTCTITISGWELFGSCIIVWQPWFASRQIHLSDGGQISSIRFRWWRKYICKNMVFQIHLRDGGANTFEYGFTNSFAQWWRKYLSSLPPRALWAGQLTHKGSCYHLLKSKEQPLSIVFVLKTLFLLSLCPIRALPATCPTRLIQN